MKKNAFTLIELLAVIVILAIVALVATPIVLNVINSSRDKSNLSSAYGIIDAARLYGVQKQFNGESIPSGDILDDLVIGGRKPESGSVYLNADGKISLTALYDNKCYIKGFNESTISVTDYDGTSCSSLELVDIFYEELQLPEEPESEPVLDETMTISNNVVTNDFFHIMTDGEVQTFWNDPEYEGGIIITNNVLTYVAEGNTKFPNAFIRFQVPNTIEDETILVKASATINTTSGVFGIVVFDSNGDYINDFVDTINNTGTLEVEFTANKGETYTLYICNIDYLEGNPSPDFTISNIKVSGTEQISIEDLNSNNEFIKVFDLEANELIIDDENIYAVEQVTTNPNYSISDGTLYSDDDFYFEFTMPEDINNQVTIEVLSNISEDNYDYIRICDIDDCYGNNFFTFGSFRKASVSFEAIPGEKYALYVNADSIKKMVITNMDNGNGSSLLFDAETNSYIYDGKIYDKNGNDITSKINISSDLPSTISVDTIDKAMYTNNYTILTSSGEKEITRYINTDFFDIFEENTLKSGLTSSLLYQCYDRYDGEEWIDLEPNQSYGDKAIRVLKGNTTLWSFTPEQK